MSLINVCLIVLLAVAAICGGVMLLAKPLLTLYFGMKFNYSKIVFQAVGQAMEKFVQDNNLIKNKEN